MVKGYISELFSSFQGEGPYVGRRQIFIRFAGCPLSCFYCDTAYARNPEPEYCSFVNRAGAVKEIENPLSPCSVLELVNELHTHDTHSICYTGGEPLFSAAFVNEIAEEAKRMDYMNFIETSGYSATAFESVVRNFDFASLDIKLRSHRAVRDADYPRLYDNELRCIRASVESGLETIVKVVVTGSTSAREIEVVCRDLSEMDYAIKFVLQPVTGTVTVTPAVEGGMSIKPEPPDIETLFSLSELAGSFLDEVMVIPQVHRYMGIL